MERPDTFRFSSICTLFCVNKVELNVDIPVNVDTPVTFKLVTEAISPVTVRSFPMVTSLGNPRVIVCPDAEVSISLDVPARVND